MRCYRMIPAGEEPAAMLRKEAQWTEPWGSSDNGAPCEKCGRTGITDHRCWSCLLTGADSECPACEGLVRWSDVCPVCRGKGLVDGRPRRGVSVYPRVEGLHHYMLVNGADLDGCLVVELEAERAPDVDFDADEGALLVVPTEILACVAPEPEATTKVKKRADQLTQQTRGSPA